MSLVWFELGLNLSLPDHCWTLYSLGQWPSEYIYIYIYIFNLTSVIYIYIYIYIYKTDVKLNCLCKTAVLEIIQLCAKKWTLAHFKMLPTNYLFTNYTYLIYTISQKETVSSWQRKEAEDTHHKQLRTWTMLMT